MQKRSGGTVLKRKPRAFNNLNGHQACVFFLESHPSSASSPWSGVLRNLNSRPVCVADPWVWKLSPTASGTSRADRQTDPRMTTDEPRRPVGWRTLRSFPEEERADAGRGNTGVQHLATQRRPYRSYRFFDRVETFLRKTVAVALVILVFVAVVLVIVAVVPDVALGHDRFRRR